MVRRSRGRDRGVSAPDLVRRTWGLRSDVNLRGAERGGTSGSTLPLGGRSRITTPSWSGWWAILTSTIMIWVRIRNCNRQGKWIEIFGPFFFFCCWSWFVGLSLTAEVSSSLLLFFVSFRGITPFYLCNLRVSMKLFGSSHRSSFLLLVGNTIRSTFWLLEVFSFRVRRIELALRKYWEIRSWLTQKKFTGRLLLSLWNKSWIQWSYARLNIHSDHPHRKKLKTWTNTWIRSRIHVFVSLITESWLFLSNWVFSYHRLSNHHPTFFVF